MLKAFRNVQVNSIQMRWDSSQTHLHTMNRDANAPQNDKFSLFLLFRIDWIVTFSEKLINV